MSRRLDQVDRAILQQLAQAERQGSTLPSLHELADAVRRSTTSVWNRMQKLEAQGLVSPPPQSKQPRSRRATQQAKMMLQQDGELPWV